MESITIGEEPLTIEQVGRVARGGRVELAPAALTRIRASRAVVDDALASGKAIYGLTTGVGHNKDVRLPDAELRASQMMLLMTHAGGVGPPAIQAARR